MSAEQPKFIRRLSTKGPRFLRPPAVMNGNRLKNMESGLAGENPAVSLPLAKGIATEIDLSNQPKLKLTGEIYQRENIFPTPQD